MKKTEALKKTIELFQAELDKATLPFRGKAIAQDSIEESRTRLAEFLAYMERKGLIESVDQNPDRPTWVIRQDAADRSKLWIMPGNDAARVVMGLPIPERKQPSDKKHPWRRDGMVEDAARKEAKVTSMLLSFIPHSIAISSAYPQTPAPASRRKSIVISSIAGPNPAHGEGIDRFPTPSSSLLEGLWPGFRALL